MNVDTFQHYMMNTANFFQEAFLDGKDFLIQGLVNLSTLTSFIGFIQGFIFYYPLFMTYLWIIGAIYYYYHWDKETKVDEPPTLDFYPLVSILVPCHNEEDNICEVMEWLNIQTYPNYEIIAVNDGSTDNTAKVLESLAQKYDRLRVVHFAENQGKAMGLRMAAIAARGEYFVCIDGDALLDPHATTWLVSHFMDSPRVGAITGNPRIRNRSTLLGRLQVGEFSSIIGMIKRTQRIYGRVFTASGVVTAFRKRALHNVGYWSVDMITEDIDISWKLQTNYWDIRYEPNALCWILMPETILGLWKQRLRWAQGGNEVLLRYWRSLVDWKRRRMWPVFLEYLVSVSWAYCMAFFFFIYFAKFFIPIPESLQVEVLIPGVAGMILGPTCLLQLFIGAVIDRKYEKGLLKNFFWMIWYVLGFWMINFLTSFVGLIKAILKPKGQRAIWVSPDRGV